MKLETKRLELVALTPAQLALWAKNLPALERELSCSYQAEPMTGFFQEIVLGQLAITERDPDNYLWHSFWLLIRRTDRVVVGSMDFKDVPDDNGETEIGYGLGEAFTHQGYMTEAVQALCDWAMRQPMVKHIIAETETDGYASQNILERCGFQKYQQGETCWWRL